MIDPNKRPVIVRSDESAEDFWSRLRSSKQISPNNFKLVSSGYRDTPFGRQQRPTIHDDTNTYRMPLIPIPNSNSRIIEKNVLQNELRIIEQQKTEFTQLKLELENTKKQLRVALKLNKGLATQICDIYAKNN
jgi:hypothetical protein